MLILQTVIAVLLLYGCYTDWKYLYVSNRVTYSIALLSIPMLNLNNQLLWFQALFIIFILVAWHLNQFGGADVKVLIPIILTLSEIPLLIFLGVMCISGMLMFIILRRQEIPQFIPITFAFLTQPLIL